MAKDEDIRKLQDDLEAMTLNYNTLQLQHIVGPADKELSSDEEVPLPRNNSIPSDMSDEEDAHNEDKKKIQEQEDELKYLRREIERCKDREAEKEEETSDQLRVAEELVSRLKQELFCSIAVSIKLNLSMHGQPSNKNIGPLYELCCKLNIPRQAWNNWVHKELTSENDN